MNEYLAYCHRVEERVVIPGRKILVGSPNSLNPYAEYTHLFLIIRGRDEKIIGRSRQPHSKSTDMPSSEYFTTQEEAGLTAKSLHEKARCTSSKCGWTENP